jgi:hypothetical protein
MQRPCAFQDGGAAPIIWSMTSTKDRAPAPPGWLEALAESEAELAAGQTVPLAPVLAELRASAARLEAQQQKQDRSPDSTPSPGA